MQGLDFASYPMGPSVRRWLGIEGAAYQGHSTPPSASGDEALAHFLEQHAKAEPVGSRDVLVDLLEELVAMGMAPQAIHLRELYSEIPLGDNFRATLALGSAAMIEAEFEEAIELLLRANLISPEEGAPYLNLAEIYYATHRDAEALSWALEGLKIMPNRGRLWELVASIHMTEDAPTAGHNVRDLALNFDSYIGLSLACEILSPNDHALKAQAFDRLYLQGLREDSFLVEYTATLGLTRQFERVPPIVWQAEKLQKEPISWQLYTHAAQAYLSLEQLEQAASIVSRLEKRGDCPAEVLQELREGLLPPIPVTH